MIEIMTLEHGTVPAQFRDVAKERPVIKDVLNFNLPRTLEAGEPPEARGLSRDQVKLMISTMHDNCVRHAIFRDLGNFLNAGDVVVINTSGTLNAALNAVRDDGERFEIHLSTRLPAGLWIVEVRQFDGNATRPFYSANASDVYALPAGGQLRLLTPYNQPERQSPGHTRLWVATLALPDALLPYLERYGFPIRYKYVREEWDNSYYQTVYANEPGSAEMPSAGRAFTPELMTRLVAKGVQIVPLILHTGVASLEDHEPPYEEYYRVPADTARVLNLARQAGKRIIAVGTTVVRALETVTDANGHTHAGEGWTDMIITPERGIRSVNAMLTGLHEPKATHLAMLEALADREHLKVAYDEALTNGYLWHEFGDMHLILP